MRKIIFNHFNSQIGYDINEMLRIIIENWFKFEEKLDVLEGAPSDDIENWKNHFNDRIKKRAEQSQYLSTNQFVTDVEDLVLEIVTTLADSKFK